MADKNYYINFDRGTRVKADGSQDSTQASLYYEEVPQWSLRFIDEATNAPVDLSFITSWSSACDDDFDSVSDPWVRVLDADIDSSDSANGVITIPLDSDTSTFQAGIGTSEYKTIFFELKGLNVSGQIEVYVRFEILAKNTLDAGGGTPPEPVGLYYTKVQSDALYMANVSGTEDNIITALSGGGIQDSGIAVSNINVEAIGLACSDEDSTLVVGTDKVTFRMPYALTLTGVRAGVNTAPTGSTIIVDINQDGTSVLSTELTIDATEKTSVTASVPAVILTSALTSDSEISVDVEQVGSTIAGTGLKVFLICEKV